VQKNIEFVKVMAERGCRVVSVCSGTYILAEAGLLNGHRATTHWRRSRHFSEQYPDVKIEPERVFVQDGNIWTSAGVSAGIDIALAIIADDYGEGLAREIAQQLVIYYRRSGGQSQFSELLSLDSPTGRFRPLLRWIRQNLNKDLTVGVLAAQANMSQRHFTRAFLSEMGETPAKVVERLRLEVAIEPSVAQGSQSSWLHMQPDFAIRNEYDEHSCAYLDVPLKVSGSGKEYRANS
jgi:transcriptional regulator GlxA family with amidase domain